MFKLAIENTVDVPVKFTTREKGKPVTHSFTLQCDRLSQDEINNALATENIKTSEFMTPLVTGWTGQRIVLDGDDQPAAFSPEALAVLFSLAGLGNVVFSAYLQEAGAKAKN